MIWLALLVAVVLVVLTVAAVLGRVDGALADATTTMSHVPLPEDPLTQGDLDGLRFDTAMRGYRMSQVDAVVDRLRREVGDLDRELARLRDEPDTVATGTEVQVTGEDSSPDHSTGEDTWHHHQRTGEDSSRAHLDSRPDEPIPERSESVSAAGEPSPTEAR